MLPLRQILKNASHHIKCSTRPMSAKVGPLVDLAVDNEGIAVMTMQRPPVNSLNLDMLQEISKALDDLTKNKAKGMILTSAYPKIFSAGLDIMELYKPDIKRVESLWTTLQEVWMKLYGSKLITAAAINGHSPAGGCLLAMSCEYRVMVNGNYSIGLNETALGIAAPRWLMDLMCNIISFRDAELALTTGCLFSVEDALKVGLIDETATDRAETLEKCKMFIKKFDEIPPMARGITKDIIRRDAITRLQQNRQQDTRTFVDHLNQPIVQTVLEIFIQEKMKQRAASK